MELNKLPEEDPDFSFEFENEKERKMPKARDLLSYAIKTEAQVITHTAKAKAACEISTRVRVESLLDKFELDDIRALEDEDLSVVREWAKLGYNTMCSDSYRILAMNKLISDFRVETKGAEPQEGVGIGDEPIRDVQIQAMKSYYSVMESFVEAVVLAEDAGLDAVLDLGDDDTDFSQLSEDQVASAKAFIKLAISTIGYEKQRAELWYRMSKGEKSTDEDNDDSEAWKRG